MSKRDNPYLHFLGKEDHLQIQVLTYLSMQYPKVLWLHPPNEGKRSPFERYKAKKMGLTSGWPDIMIFKPKAGINSFNAGLAIELKIKPNKLSDFQVRCLELLEEAGWVTEVCFDFEEAKRAIKNYMEV